MRRPELELLDDELDDLPPLRGTDLGLAFDLTREELDDDDDALGLRALYECPETVIRPSRWPHAA